MKIVHFLNSIVKYLDTTRGVGHTRAAKAGAEAVGGILVCHSREFATVVRSEVSNGVTVLTVDDMDRLAGVSSPLVLDNHVIRTLAAASLNEIRRLEDEARLYYHADGTSEYMPTAGDVVERRIAAAKEIKSLRAEVATLRLGWPART